MDPGQLVTKKTLSSEQWIVGAARNPQALHACCAQLESGCVSLDPLHIYGTPTMQDQSVRWKRPLCVSVASVRTPPTNGQEGDTLFPLPSPQSSVLPPASCRHLPSPTISGSPAPPALKSDRPAPATITKNGQGAAVARQGLQSAAVVPTHITESAAPQQFFSLRLCPLLQGRSTRL